VLPSMRRGRQLEAKNPVKSNVQQHRAPLSGRTLAQHGQHAAAIGPPEAMMHALASHLKHSIIIRLL